jgi:hypothetical protein
MFRNMTRCWMVLSALTLGLPLWAASPQDEIRKVLSACGDDQTAVLARADLTRIDVDAAFDLAEQSLSRVLDPETAARVHAAWQGPRQRIHQRIDRLKAAGAGAIYGIWGPQDMSQYVLAVPVTPGANETALTQAVAKDWVTEGLTQVNKAGVIVVATPSIVERLKATSSPAGVQWGPAIEKAAAGSVQVFVAPSQDSKRIVEEMLPGLAGELVQVPDHALSRGLQWATLSLDLSPRLALKAYVQSADPGSAQGLGQMVTRSLDSVAEALELKASQPGGPSPLARLAPAVSGNNLALSLDTQQCIGLLDEAIAPALIRMNRHMARNRCMSNLLYLGRDLAYWANDHGDKMPPNLEIAVKEQKDSIEMLRCAGNEIGEIPASYVYRGADLGTLRDATLILAHDPKGCHCGGRGVLIADCHSEWLTEEQFQEQVKEDNEARRKLGLPEKPAE